MANEAEQAIYDRLRAAGRYHPASANLFTDDWALEPGDVVTVQSEGDDYSMPVFSMSLDWNGSSMVSVESTGNKERAPLPELKRRRYSGGRSAHDETKEQGEHFEAEFVNQGNMIGMVVEKKDGVNVIKAASITAAIDDSTGVSVATISADHILFDGQVKVSDTLNVSDGSLFVKYAAMFGTIGSYVSINNGTVNAPTLQVNSNGKLVFAGTTTGAHYDLTYASIQKHVTGFDTPTASGGRISIPYYTVGSGTVAPAGNITFNIADTAYYQAGIGVESVSLASVSQAAYEAAQYTEETLTEDGYYICTATPNDTSGDYGRFKMHVPAGGAKTGDEVTMVGANTDHTERTVKPSNAVDKSASAISGEIWAQVSGKWRYLRTFSFSISSSVSIENHVSGYIRGKAVINGGTVVGTSLGLTSARISGWGGPI